MPRYFQSNESHAYGYDALLRLTSRGWRLQAMSTGTLQSLFYQYDLVSDITQIQDAITNETQTFVYDALYRLTSAAASNGLAPYSESYTYDPTTGNLASKGGVSYTYGDPDHVHAVTSAGTNTYEYDDNGNQVTRNIGSDSFALVYDAENRLVEVKKNGLTIATFAYDGDGKRVKSVIGGETTLFVGGHYEVVNGSASKYYFAGAQRIAVRKNGTLSYLLADHLGSTSIATDGSGNKVSEIRYKAWGEVRYASGAWVTDYTYTGQYSNVDDFGLMFYGARWYDPDLGRLTQSDSVIPDYDHSLDWDRYCYTRNNPIRYSDSTGHWSEDQLKDWLGEDWEDYYFGEGGIFKDREALKDFLTDPDVTDLFNLYVVKEFFRLATYMDSGGINIGEYDAIGCRFTGMVGAGGITGANVDAILNLKSGELSYFAAGDGAGGWGVTGAAGAGYILLKGLSNNSEYLGPSKTVGTSFAHGVGINVEGFSGGLINGNTSTYSGLYVGGLVGEGFSFYGAASYTYVEALNVSARGYSIPKSVPGPVTVLSQLGDMFWNDIFHFGK